MCGALIGIGYLVAVLSIYTTRISTTNAYYHILSEEI